MVPATVKYLNLKAENLGTGNVWFDDVMIRKTDNTALVNLQVPDISYKDRQLKIKYNAFKSPYEIEETGVDKINFVYNDNNDRSVMFYGSLDTNKELRPMRKHYSADGTMEIKQNIQTGEIEFVTYIGGDGYSAPAVYKKTVDGATTTQQTLYLHRDYQGSILAITDANAVVLEKRLFDAWGAVVKVIDGNNQPVADGSWLLDRGYTGHEHLQSVGLIHMNGRLYDPKLHRFLQPDNYVQDPGNTQNYNRYGYVLNNPLKYTDPSGERWRMRITWSDVFSAVEIVVGAAILFTPGVNVALGVVGAGLVGSGIQHFSSAYSEYKQTGDWASASNNAGYIVGIKMDTDVLFGDNKSKSDLNGDSIATNGITQSQPVVKPKSDTNGGGQEDPLKNHAGEVKHTLEEWAVRYQNKSWEEIATENGWKQGQPLGPNKDWRYIKAPDGRVMDMRHVTIVGYKYGEVAGNTIEHIQFVLGQTGSAYDPQDYYSNKIGAMFYQLRSTGSWSSNSWAYDFKRFIETQYNVLFKNYKP